MTEGDTAFTGAGNLKKPSIPVVIRQAKIVWERIAEEMVQKSYLKCGIYNKMDGTKDDALYEDFLEEGVNETEDVVDYDGQTDYYDNSPATHEISDQGFVDDENCSDFEGFYHIIGQKIL